MSDEKVRRPVVIKPWHGCMDHNCNHCRECRSCDCYGATPK